MVSTWKRDSCCLSEWLYHFFEHGDLFFYRPLNIVPFGLEGLDRCLPASNEPRHFVDVYAAAISSSGGWSHVRGIVRRGTRAFCWPLPRHTSGGECWW